LLDLVKIDRDVVPVSRFIIFWELVVVFKDQ
jgi:hypothetical protein